jgi:hypothetical protein
MSKFPLDLLVHVHEFGLGGEALLGEAVVGEQQLLVL